MGKKGTPHRKWSKEEKLRFIRLHLDLSLIHILLLFYRCNPKGRGMFFY